MDLAPSNPRAFVGEVRWFCRPDNPAGWEDADGGSLLRTAYPHAFAAWGTTFGAADGAHFNKPDLRGRVPVGAGTGAGLTARTLGDTGGAETVSTGDTPALWEYVLGDSPDRPNTQAAPPGSLSVMQPFLVLRPCVYVGMGLP